MEKWELKTISIKEIQKYLGVTISPTEIEVNKKPIGDNYLFN